MIEFDENLKEYTFETDGIVFCWKKEPGADCEGAAKIIAANYKTQLSKIIAFMYADIQETFGNVAIDAVKDHLGKPIIDMDIRQVTYTEQTFDMAHIFSFEFADDEFNELQYFSIDG